MKKEAMMGLVNLSVLFNTMPAKAFNSDLEKFKNSLSNLELKVTDGSGLEEIISPRYIPLSIDHVMLDKLADNLTKVFESRQIEMDGVRLSYNEFIESVDYNNPSASLGSLTVDGEPMEFEIPENILEGVYLSGNLNQIIFQEDLQKLITHPTTSKKWQEVFSGYLKMGLEVDGDQSKLDQIQNDLKEFLSKLEKQEIELKGLGEDLISTVNEIQQFRANRSVEENVSIVSRFTDGPMVSNPEALGVIATAVVASTAGAVASTVVSKVIDRMSFDNNTDVLKNDWINSDTLKFKDGVLHIGHRGVSKLVELGIVPMTEFPAYIDNELIVNDIKLNPNITSLSKAKMIEAIKNRHLKLEINQ